jgi:hypothetical protein
MKYVFAAAIAGLSLTLLMEKNYAQEKAKFTIAEVMDQAHKGGLMKKVSSGKGSADEKKQLLDLYTALSQNEPPKGNAKDWKDRTSKLVAAAKKAADGDEKAAKSLPGLANCGACHKLHKG